jgi:hypothetical protein
VGTIFVFDFFFGFFGFIFFISQRDVAEGKSMVEWEPS